MKSIQLTEAEHQLWQRISLLRHFDETKQTNTWPEYHEALKHWTASVRQHHKLEPNEPFFFL